MKQKQLLGDAQPDAKPMRFMRERGGSWYAYQNHDLGHPMIGHLQFLKCGPDCTFKTPPKRAPDTRSGFGWRYVLVGRVNLETGRIESAPE